MLQIETSWIKQRSSWTCSSSFPDVYKESAVSVSLSLVATARSRALLRSLNVAVASFFTSPFSRYSSFDESLNSLRSSLPCSFRSATLSRSTWGPHRYLFDAGAGGGVGGWLEREALETFIAFILQHFSRPRRLTRFWNAPNYFFLQKLGQFCKIVELCGFL